MLAVNQSLDLMPANVAGISKVWAPQSQPSGQQPTPQVVDLFGQPHIKLTCNGQHAIYAGHVRSQLEGKPFGMFQPGETIELDLASLTLLSADMPKSLSTAKGTFGIVLLQPNFSSPYQGPPPLALYYVNGGLLELRLPSGQVLGQPFPAVFDRLAPLKLRFLNAAKGNAQCWYDGREVWQGNLPMTTLGSPGRGEPRLCVYMDDRTCKQATAYFSKPTITRLS